MVTFFVICFFIISALFLFLLFTQKYVNPYKLIMIFGKKGSGKSTTLTKIALQHVHKGWTVYSTERIPYTYYVSPDQIGFVHFEDFNYVPFIADNYKGLIKWFKVICEKFSPTRPKVLLLVDEVGMIWDNRNYKSFKPDVRNWFKLQRHYYTKVVLFSQTFDIDKKLRDLTDAMYLQRNVARVFTYGKKIRKFITINNNSDDGGKLDESFEYESFFWFWLGSRTLTFIPHWAKYFDSFEAPELQHIEYVQTVYYKQHDELPDEDADEDPDEDLTQPLAELVLDNERPND